jgi:hypothetical protein
MGRADIRRDASIVFDGTHRSRWAQCNSGVGRVAGSGGEDGRICVRVMS